MMLREPTLHHFVSSRKPPSARATRFPRVPLTVINVTPPPKQPRARPSSPASLPVNNKHVPSSPTVSRFPTLRIIFYDLFICLFNPPVQAALIHLHMLFTSKCGIGLPRQQRGMVTQGEAARAHARGCARASVRVCWRVFGQNGTL